jgi:predicted RNase H-like HicB family nuclease
MSCQRDRTFIALVGWNTITAGFEGFVAGIPELEARGSTQEVLIARLSQALQAWLDATGATPIGGEVRLRPVRLDS